MFLFQVEQVLASLALKFAVLKYIHKLQDMAEQCGGYDFETKENIHYECPICKKIIRQFTELPCEHATCKSCIDSWELKKLEMFGERV